ncbi:MAG: hypothetical protein IBJ03_18190 [Gemmatimonadaceae bacterium]|nr:hypothetical protein [Gemmatimonadaceae bacterium]
MRADAGRAMQRLVLMTCTWALSAGCVYYNGVYNAQAAAKQGNARLKRNQDADAQSRFLESAERAETVLVRHPNSKWQTRALYLAGRGHALSGDCEKGRLRITEFLGRADAPRDDRDRARVALAACDVRENAMTPARVRLDSLIDVPNGDVAREARRWAARAALTVGDLDAVGTYLGSSSTDVLPWELINASMTARDFTRTESLLVLRAQRGDYRDEVVRAVRDMSNDGRFTSAERVVKSYDLARVREPARAAMHYALGDQLLRAERDSLAAIHLQSARELATRDTIISREAVARAAFIALRRARSLDEADSILSRLDSGVMRVAYTRRLTEQMLLVRLLSSRSDATGAGAYLAAEVARDSLRAPALAQGMFVQFARAQTGSPLAPSAWYAATLLPSPLTADSLERWRRRITTEYSASAVAAWLQGEDPAMRPDFVTTPELLKFNWTETTRIWADSVRKLRQDATRAPRTP